MTMDDARLDHLSIIVEGARGRHSGPEADSYDLEALVDQGEIMLSDVAWLIERITSQQQDIASGPIDWHVKPWGPDRIVIEMRSRVRPTTWLAMHVDRQGWQEIKDAAERQLLIAESMNGYGGAQRGATD